MSFDATGVHPAHTIPSGSHKVGQSLQNNKETVGRSPYFLLPLKFYPKYSCKRTCASIAAFLKWFSAFFALVSSVAILFFQLG